MQNRPFSRDLNAGRNGGLPGPGRSRTEEWTYGGHSTKVTFWDRPLHAMTDAFTAAGFLFFVLEAH